MSGGGKGEERNGGLPLGMRYHVVVTLDTFGVGMLLDINSCADRLWKKKVYASWHSRVWGTLLKVVRQHAVIKYAL